MPSAKRFLKWSSHPVIGGRHKPKWVVGIFRNLHQAWQQIDMGHEMAFKSITGSIFEFGFSDSILQMWAAFLYELQYGRPLKKFARCVTPEETAMIHMLFTAAIESQREGTAVPVR